MCERPHISSIGETLGPSKTGLATSKTCQTKPSSSLTLSSSTPPWISEELLERAVNYTKTINAITEQQESIIWHSKKSLLFNENSTWTKKDGSLFNVTMGALMTQEYVSLLDFMFSTYCPQDQVGLYREHGLSALNLSGPQSDRARKDIIQTFKDCGLHVTVAILLHPTDFLDVTFDLPTDRYWPFLKPGIPISMQIQPPTHYSEASTECHFQQTMLYIK